MRAQVADSLADAAKTHVTHPFGASTTSRTSLEEISQDETFNRRLTGARARLSEIATALQTSTTGSEKNRPRTGEELRWAVYNEVKGQRFERTDEEWAPFLRSPARRLEQLLVWPESTPLPRWRLIEAWTVAAHGPYMAVAGGFRLAFWSEDARHHGPRLDRALARYARYADARPAGFPAAPVAAFARFLAEHTPRQDGPEHGMAYDVQRFNELTKQMSAYAHYTRDGHLQLAAARARRRDRARQLAEQLNNQLRLRFRTGDDRPGGRLRLASELLDSDYPAHQAAGKAIYATAKRAERLVERDERLRAGQHPGQRGRPLPRRLHLRRAVGPRDATGTVDGELVVLPAPHASRLLQRLLGELDADLLVLEQLPERVTELGGVVKQARPGVRLAGEAFESPLRDPRGLPRRQAQMRDGRRAGEIRQIARDQRDRAALQHAAEDHHVAARVLDRRRAPLRPLVRAHHKTVQLEPHRSQSSPPAATPRAGTAWSPPARGPGTSCGR